MAIEFDVPKVIVPLESWRMLMAYVDLAETEITGFFDVDYDATQHAFIVGKVYLVEQEAGAAHVEMDEDVIGDFSFQLISQGVDQLPRGWWHSHVNMDAFFSTTDYNTIDRDFSNDSFTLSIVLNKKRKYKATAVIWERTPYNIIAKPIKFDDLEVVVQYDTWKIPVSLEKEVKKKVKTKPVVVYTPKDAPSYTGSHGSFDFTGGHYGKPYNNYNKNKSKLKTKVNGKTPLTLPKDRWEALEKIERLDLIRTYKAELKTYVFVDPNNDDIWLDGWGCVTMRDYEALKGKDDTDRSETGTYSKTSSEDERCLKCHYTRDLHDDDVCPMSIFPSDVPDGDLLDGDEMDGY